jgi:ribosomal peptide maturation radical SAM protein 1
MTDVCLIVVPYYSVRRPSIALGLLKAGLTNNGISSKVVYANLKFAEMIGGGVYDFIDAYSIEDLLGEWTFSKKAFGGIPGCNGAIDSNVRKYLHLAKKTLCTTQVEPVLAGFLNGQSFEDFFLAVRETAAVFVDRIAKHVIEEHPRIVGCSSTFQEHCASLALLRRIKEMDPSVITVMGGANCETTLGAVTYKYAQWVDYMVSGEGDGIFPDLCRCLLKEGAVCEKTLPMGVFDPASRFGNMDKRKRTNRAVVATLDDIPIPDYDEYFDELDKSTLGDQITPLLLIETSRGCWWGQRNPCAFCSLNGLATVYRSKTPERVYTELTYLTGKYGINNLLAVDNILDMSYFETLLPRLEQFDRKVFIGYETKANLSRKRVERLARAGIVTIQAGIESLHTEILKRLNKGCTPWINIELLKWTREFGININWSLLYGLPDDNDHWYRDMARMIPLITHLQSPMSAHKIFFTRFSRYFNNQTRYGLSLSPHAAYYSIYPFSPEDMNEFAFVFVNNRQSFNDDIHESVKKRGMQEMLRTLQEWQRLWMPFRQGIDSEPSTLTMEQRGNDILIYDSRPCAQKTDTILQGMVAGVYRICDTASTPGRIASKLTEEYQAPVERTIVSSILEELIAMNLLLKIENRYISLAVRKPRFKYFWEKNFPENDTYFSEDISLEELFGKRGG